jgi:hypothetical protein
MGVTVKVNGVVNSLAHKGAGHASPATLPDVCKTPSPGGPVPLPYPNFSRSSTLSGGTSTVKADGGNMIAIKGSKYSSSNGDEPGTAGGVKSSTFGKASSWISYSFDVKIEGKNACRLTDKKFQNNENTVDLAGDLGPIVRAVPAAAEFACAVQECDAKPLTPEQKQRVSESDEPCSTLGDIKHQCVNDKMSKCKGAQVEPSYDTKPTPVERLMRSGKNSHRPCKEFYSAIASMRRKCTKEGVKYQKGRMRRPDCVIGDAPPRTVLDAKFPCPASAKKKPLRGNTFRSAATSGEELWRPGQREAYEKIAGETGSVAAVSPHDVKSIKPPVQC